MKRDAGARRGGREVRDYEKISHRRIEDLQLKRGMSGLSSRWRYIRETHKRPPAVAALEEKVIHREEAKPFSNKSWGPWHATGRTASNSG
jgi:hypothetical protein